MKNNIEKSLNRAVDQLPHPNVNDLWDIPVSTMTEHDDITRQENTRPALNRTAARTFMAAAACFMLVLVGGAMHIQNQVVRTVVDIDINPGIELNLNGKGKVVFAAAVDDESEQLLNAADIMGKSAGDAIELIMMEAKELHYFSQNENAVLLSVSAKDDGDAVWLEEALSQQVRIAVDRKETPVTVVSQRFDKEDQDQRDSSAKYKISQGKMALIRKIMSLDPSYSAEQFVSLPIEHLLLLLREAETDFSNSVKVDASAWLSEKTSVPVIEEKRLETEETRDNEAPETGNAEIPAIQSRTEQSPVETKPLPSETKPVPAETRPAPAESKTSELVPPVHKIPHTLVQDQDDIDDDDQDDPDDNDRDVKDDSDDANENDANGNDANENDANGNDANENDANGNDVNNNDNDVSDRDDDNDIDDGSNHGDDD